MNLLTGLLIVLAVLIYTYYRYKKHEKNAFSSLPTRNGNAASFDKDDYKFIKYLVDSYMEKDKSMSLKDSIYLKDIKAKCDEGLKQYSNENR